MCLKFLRQANFLDVYELLQRRSGVVLEHVLITKLYEALVIEGNYEKSEDILVEAAKGKMQKLFEHEMNSKAHF